jgi:phosphatidate cytidylyltransferase
VSAPAVPSSQPAKKNETRTRVWMGAILILLVAGVLLLDQSLAGWLGLPLHPCLFLFLLVLGALSCLELHTLLAALPRPPLWLVLLGIVALILSNWPAHLGWTGRPPQPWRDLAWVFAAVVLAGFLYELAVFREPGSTIVRCSLLVWMVCYLGLLPSFLAQLRWWPAEAADQPDLRCETAIALTIFVAKGADIGAYFTGRLIGRHRMSPVISPKKTWEGLAGGLALAALIAVVLNRALVPLLPSDINAALFGVVVGGAGVLGDLAESLIKRDCRQKDASQTVPGFGGVLDIVDSVLFAAPVAYWWLRGW